MIAKAVVATYRRSFFLPCIGQWMAWMVCLLAGIVPGIALAAEYSVGPVPAWVVPAAPGTPTSAQLSRDSDGVSYLLMDRQVRVDPAGRTQYRRVVSRALNPHGVESIANIEVDFDPSYQTLTLHAIDVIRQGRVIPKLATARIRVIERETELDARIFDGMKTADIFLDDVRVGDTIDYAYSVTGTNPVFGGGTFGRVPLQFSVPVAHVHVRLIVPDAIAVTVASLHTSPKPAMARHDGLRDYSWDIADAPALTIEDGAPDSYDPYAAAAWSGYADWAAVVHWAQPLYALPNTLSPRLEAEVDRIAKAEKTPTGRLLAALRLVQGEVRYLGVEVGANSHKPNPPALVFDRRFGDCKDKALLTMALLGRLGIEAHAALVSTDSQRGLAEELPNPGAFDHVIVRATLDHKQYWIDPTRPTQRSDLAHLVQPDFGLALVVDPATTQLTPMDTTQPRIARRDLHVVFDARADFAKPIRYTVTTTYAGAEAESQRADLAENNLAEVQKNYLNWYANFYPHITVAAPLKVEDDESNNRLTIAETYDIANIATVSQQGRRHTVAITVADFDTLFNDPKVTIRKAPLRVDYPLEVNQTTEVLLPSDWPIKPDTDHLENPAFAFDQTIGLDGLRLTITDHFRSLAAEVKANDMPKYLADLARVRDQIDYQLNWTDPPVPSATKPAIAPPTPVAQASGMDRINWPIALLMLASLAILCRMAVRAYRFDPPPRGNRDDRFNGLRGWLIVLAIVLVIGGLAVVKILTIVMPLTAVETWSRLTTFGTASYDSLWAPLILFQLIMAVGRLVLAILLVATFFRRRTSFPWFVVAFLGATVFAHTIETLLMHYIPRIPLGPKEHRELLETYSSSAIWIAYVLLSRRVKSTFVNRRSRERGMEAVVAN